ncbi:MAG: hypothetical protein WC312_05915 [Candidatus Omnitrophota bacterium]
MKEQNSLDIKILDVDIRLVSGDRKFFYYLSSLFKRYETVFEEEKAIISSFDWQDEFLKKNPLKLCKTADYSNIGPNIALSKKNNGIKFLKKIHGKRFKVDFKISGNKIQQEFLCHRKLIKDFFDSLKGKKQYMDLFEISYYLFYYPFFWFLENFRDIHLLHASCVDTPKGGIVIAGLPGSGKSVTSLGLWNKRPENKLISDNIVLYDRENIYTCPEPIRLHDEGKKLIDDKRLQRIDILNKNTCKGFYKIDEGRKDKCKPVIFLLAGLSDETIMEEMNSESAAGMVFNQSLQGAEILNYFEYASLLNFLKPEKNLFKDRMESLSSLFKNVKCFSLTISRNNPIDSTVDKIMSLL